jgi:aspartate kinase
VALDRLKMGVNFAQVSIAIADGLSKVSVVGVGMRSHSGVAKRAFRTLADKNIDISMISTSEIKISCVIAREHGESAAQAWHEQFFEAES